jgi:hypothetical protein
LDDMAKAVERYSDFHMSFVRPGAAWVNRFA